MANCPTCSAINPDGAIACASCGSPLIADSPEGMYTLRPGTMLGNGRFTVGKVLGQGGFGITYLGSNIENRQAVAIKEFFLQGCVRQGTTVRTTGSITPQSFETIKQRFLDESKLLGQFRHPGIVRVLATLEENGTAYMVMDYLKGRTLKQILETQGVVPEREAVAYAVKVAEALEEIHKAGILHRDIKPENIIVTEDGRVVLIDFGLARQFAAGQTKMMTSWLTPGYAPIEQYGQKGQFGATTDIYSLGATLYHLLTGQMPDLATDRIVLDKLKSPREVNGGVSQGVSDAVMFALQMDPAKRPQSAYDFIEALGGFRSGILPAGAATQRNSMAPTQFMPQGASPGPSGIKRGQQKTKILPIVLIVFAVVVIAALVGISIIDSHNKNSGDPGSSGSKTTVVPDGKSGSNGGVTIPKGGPADIPEENTEGMPPVVPPSEAEARAFVQRWVQDWQSRDIEAYSDLYDPEFQGVNYSPGPGYQRYDYSQWIADKRSKFKSSASIQVGVGNLQVDVGSDQTTLTFIQNFSAVYTNGKTYSDTGQKKMVIRRSSGGIRIFSEDWHAS